MIKNFNDFIYEGFSINQDTIKGSENNLFMQVPTEIAKTMLRVHKKTDIRMILGSTNQHIIELIEDNIIPKSKEVYSDIPSNLYDIDKIKDLDINLREKLDDDTYYLYKYNNLEFVLSKVDGEFESFESIFYFKDKDSIKWNFIINNFYNLN